MGEQADQRIAVIGSPGGGKSVLATAIAAASGLPLIHLDTEHWRPGWVEPDTATWRAHNVALAAGDRWVIDGNYGGTLPIRLARATLVVWLDLPTRVCLAGVVRRAVRYRRGGRPDMAADCPERFDRAWLTFLYYVATFRRQRRPALAARLAASEVALIHLDSVMKRSAFIDRLSADGIAALTALPD